jgi:hypothetical protein
MDNSLHKYYYLYVYVSNHGHVMFGGMEWNLFTLLHADMQCKQKSTCCSAMTVATKFESVRAKLIVYGHYVSTLINPYFKLCIILYGVSLIFYCIRTCTCTCMSVS